MGGNTAEKINVVYASDDNFVDVLGISIVSLFENNRGIQISLYILSDAICDANKMILRELVDLYGGKITFVELDFDMISSVEMNALSWARATFSRLFMGTLLKTYGIEKAIYLDCDMIVRGSIKELWEFDLEQFAIGAVMDPVSALHKRNIGLSNNQPYYNAGMLVVDFKNWMDYSCEEKLMSFAKERKGKVPYVDQGIINGSLFGLIKTIPLKYNVTTVFFENSFEDIQIYRKPGKCFYSKDEVEEAKKNPIIIHYTKSIFTRRPWVENSNHVEKECWLKYKEKSPWNDKVLIEDVKSKGMRMYLFVSEKIPKKIEIRLRGILHSVIKPIWEGRM